MDTNDIAAAKVPPLVGYGSESAAGAEFKKSLASWGPRSSLSDSTENGFYLQGSKAGMAKFITRSALEAFCDELIDKRCLRTYFPELESGCRALSPEIGFSTSVNRRSRILAILLLIREAKAMGRFLEAGIDDHHLPFRILPSRPDGTLQVQSERKPDRVFDSFLGLGKTLATKFIDTQWSLLAPCLSVPRKAPPLALHPETILPFTSAELFNSGAYSKVYRVSIHEDYWDDWFTSSATQRPKFYAVKKLDGKDEAAFAREVAVLQELNEFAHPHIVPLLSSFKLGDELHLMFPWADCDLSMFWRLNANPEPSVTTSRWMLKQLMGLADGLSLLHGFEKGRKDRRWDGRHGDVKPANILVFAQPSNTAKDSIDRYALKLCDFGLSSFKKRGVADATCRDPELSPKHTPVYRAPEFDLKPCVIGGSADIWSLGCVFLEAASWLVAGVNGLQCLAYCREDSGSSTPSHDAFFSMSASTDGNWDSQPTLKAQVFDWMILLRNHPHSSDFIDDLLDLVARQMLIVESENPPRRRSSSRDVCEALVRLLEKLGADETYASPRCANCMCPPQGCIGRPEDNQCPTHGDVLKMAPSKRSHDGKRKRQETYAPDDKEKSAAFEQPKRLFACPFYKEGMPMGRACIGPGWDSVHRVKEHLLRPHTPKSFRDPSGCSRCLQGFKTKELLSQHLRQEPQCLIKAPEIIAGQLTLEQAANLRSTRKKSDMSEEDRWFEIYRILFPDHDLSTMNVTPYHEMTVSSIDTLSTQSSTGMAEFRTYIQQSLQEKTQKMEAEFRDMGFDPEMSKTLAAKFHQDQLKSLQEFEDNKFKLTYGIGVGGSDSKVHATSDGLIDPAGAFDFDPYFGVPGGSGEDGLDFMLPFKS